MRQFSHVSLIQCSLRTKLCWLRLSKYDTCCLCCLLDTHKHLAVTRVVNWLTAGPASTAALVVPVTRHSTLGDRAFPVIAAKLWNALPSDITSATSLLTFRHKLKTFLFRRSYGTWPFRTFRVYVLVFYFLVFYFLVFLRVFIVHLYHANQFVVMTMMMKARPDLNVSVLLTAIIDEMSRASTLLGHLPACRCYQLWSKLRSSVALIPVI